MRREVPEYWQLVYAQLDFVEEGTVRVAHPILKLFGKVSLTQAIPVVTDTEHVFIFAV
jgi:hypothetical protein